MSLNNHTHKVNGTREQFRQEKKKQQESAVSRPKRRNIRIRLIPIWLRVLIVALLVVVFAIFGAMFGYSAMGDGEVKEVFQTSTWTHIKDLIVKE